MKPKSSPNPYHLLGVTKAATVDEIRKAYLSKALIYHPDKGGDEDMMKNLVQAYNSLRSGNADVSDEDFYSDSEGPSFSNLTLSNGFKQSDVYRELLKNWKEEFLTKKLKDNFSEAFVPAVERALKNLEFNIEMAQSFKDNNFEVNDNEVSPSDFYDNLNCAIQSRDFDCLLAALSEITPQNADSTEFLIKLHEAQGNLRDPRGQVIGLIIYAAAHKTRGDALKSLECLQNALMILPDEETAKAVGTMMQDQTYTITSMKAMYQEFKQLREEINSQSFNPVRYKFLGFDDIPLKDDYVQRLQPTPYIRCLKKYEKSIAERLAMEEPLEAAFAYIDMTMATNDGASYAGSLVFAAAYFLKSMQFSDDPTLIYACRKAIIKISLSILQLCTTYLDPFIKLHFTKMTFSITMQSEVLFSSCHKELKSNGVESVESIDIDIINNLLDNLTQSARVSPFFLLPITLVCDTLFFGLIGSKFLEFYLPHVVSLRQAEDLADDDIQLLAQYYIFEGTWKQWMSQKDFTAERERCLSAFIQYYGLKSYEIEDLLTLDIVQRNKGWLHEGKAGLRFPGRTSYSKVLGVEFDLERGDVNFLLQESRGGENGLFDWNDIEEVLRHGIQQAAFTLDHPSFIYPNHPFQEMKYFPESLKDTNYLKTLLHVDYLLKMISTDIEVDTEFPFEQKSAKEGFLKRLPPDLMKALRVIDDKESSSSNQRMHRFWIENEAVTYDWREEQNKLTFLVGDMKMKVLKHALKHNEKGEIVDATNDNENESPEALFSKNFTEYYEQIGEYFPEILRLRELIKLSVIYNIIAENFFDWKEKSQTLKFTPDYKSLEENRKKIRFPLATDSGLVESELDSCIQKNGFTRSQVSATEINRVRSEIVNHLRNQETSLIQEYVEGYSKAYKISIETLRPYVLDYLHYSNSQKLGDFLAKHREDQEKAKYAKICSAIEKTGVYTKKQTGMQGWPEPNGCVWIPAAFGLKAELKVRRTVYGGVLLSPELKKGSLQAPQNGYKVTSLLNNSVANKTGNNSGMSWQANATNNISSSDKNNLSSAERFIFVHEVIPSRLDKAASWHKPSARSGPTIGVGCDVKARERSDVKNLFIGSGVDPATAEIQSKAAKLEGSAASQFVKAHKDFKLTETQLYALFKKTYQEQEKEVIRMMGKRWNMDYNDPNLSGAVKTVLVDMKYRGDFYALRKDLQSSVEHSLRTGNNSRLQDYLRQHLKRLESNIEKENKIKNEKRKLGKSIL